MKRIILTGLLLAAPLSLGATESVRSQPAGSTRDQWEVEQWLQLQRSGRQASANRQAATPAERDRAYRRYLDSYSHPIPEYLLDENQGFSTGSK
ncbi:Protein of unknown function [Pseudomonas delhiensis]|uniref:DUF3613 domain-containing protein n=1 Tax=Pseudomonas delhiensis TaxID=366289 RepID=A0A239NHI6_9PSED|nr:DUF3613 domain-containing protein [Pseudomonas delhiensis]SDK92228.1 Protein of unknown function [Pseudomonas delhiensis]SNT54351.1 Protein of unknown function [Pseudomonas delhiensis]